MQPHTCPVCQGMKQVQNPNQFGHSAATPCPACGGTGLAWEPSAAPGGLDELFTKGLEACREIDAFERGCRHERTQQTTPQEETKGIEPKALNVTSSRDLLEKASDAEVFGNLDAWQLICKASSFHHGWIKSTKAMEIPGIGCLVQVSTQQGEHVAESVCFVPFVSVTTDEKGVRSITPSKLVKDMFEALVERLQDSLRNGGPGPSATVHED